MTKFTIQTNDANQTVFKFLKKSFSSTPLSVIYKWFRVGAIKVNHKRTKDLKLVLKINDLVEVFDHNEPKPRNEFKYVTNPNLDVVYEDENILIVNKPANLEVHSPINISLDDLVKSYLVNEKKYDPENESSFVVSHVHRLDKLVSGLIIYAKNKIALNILLECFQDKKVLEKFYLAKVKPEAWKNDFFGNGWIKYDSDQQVAIFSEKKQSGYKEANAFFKLVKKEKDSNLIEIQLITGRKHQIRATLAYYKMPILNDFRYHGKKINSEKMIYLTAYKLIFGQIPAPLDYLNGQEIVLKLNNW